MGADFPASSSSFYDGEIESVEKDGRCKVRLSGSSPSTGLFGSVFGGLFGGGSAAAPAASASASFGSFGSTASAPPSLSAGSPASPSGFGSASSDKSKGKLVTVHPSLIMPTNAPTVLPTPLAASTLRSFCSIVTHTQHNKQRRLLARCGLRVTAPLCRAPTDHRAPTRSRTCLMCVRSFDTLCLVDFSSRCL